MTDNDPNAALFPFLGLSEGYLEYIRYGRPRPVSKATHRTHAIRIRYLQKLIGDKDVRSVSRQDANLVRADMVRRGCRPKYVGAVLSVLRAFLRYCADELCLEVMDPKAIRLPPQRSDEVRFVGKESLAAFVASIPKDGYHGVRMMACVATFLDTGMRVSELVSLDRAPFDRLTDEGVSAMGACDLFQVPIVGKGGKGRVVFFRQWSLRWIRRYLSMREDAHPALFVNNTPNCEVGRMLDEGVRRYFRQYSEKAGVQRVLPHALRRTGATYLRENGADIFDIQKWLGHSKIAITERYVGVNWGAVRSSIGRYQTYGEIETLL